MNKLHRSKTAIKYFYKAIDAHDAKRYMQAIKACDKAIEIYPQLFTQVLISIVVMLARYALLQAKQGIEYYSKAVELNRHALGETTQANEKFPSILIICTARQAFTHSRLRHQLEIIYGDVFNTEK